MNIEHLTLDKEECKRIQQLFVNIGYLESPVDGVCGRYTRQAFLEWANGVLMSDKDLRALEYSNDEFPLGNDLASQIVKEMLVNKFYVSRGNRRYNIVYVEGMTVDGVGTKGNVNNDLPDGWNDIRCVIEWPRKSVPLIRGIWKATSEPGLLDRSPINPAGWAILPIPSQFKAWRVGTHKAGTKTAHAALVQVAEITVLRTPNMPVFRVNAKPHKGLFGINQHHGWNSNRVKNNSIGCLVGQSIEGHVNFLNLCKLDVRYAINTNYIFYTSLLDSRKVLGV